MLICIFGENCTGKSTLSHIICEQIPCQVYSGKDYLRLAKNENIAKTIFQKKLHSAINGENIIYIISEKEHLSMIPNGAIRILVTANLEVIKTRFAQRMRGTLPLPVAAMLEKNHGYFDHVPHDFHVISGETDESEILRYLSTIKL
jgi:cytidylate kinase